MMSLINLPAMLAALVIIAFIYFGLQRKRLKKTWGDMRHGIWTALIRRGLLVLRGSEYHPINWQPHILVLGGSPKARRHLLDLGAWIGGDRGMVTYTFLVKGDCKTMGERRNQLQGSLQESIIKEHPSIFAKVHVCAEIFPGALSVAQASGVAGFEPNTVLLGWTQEQTNVPAYTELLRGLYRLDKCILSLSYDNDKGFGDHRSIDIWWGGLENNGALMLLLTTMLKQSSPWAGATVKVKMIVGGNAPLSATRRNLEKIIGDARVEAEAAIIARNPPDKPRAEIIAEHSKADLVMLGLRPPEEEETAEHFESRVSDLLDGVGTALLVRSSSEFKGAEMLFEQEWKKPEKEGRGPSAATTPEPGDEAPPDGKQESNGSQDATGDKTAKKVD
jgi:hypothetical protein